MQIKTLILIALTSACSQFTHAAPMLLTATGFVWGVDPRDDFHIVGSEVVATWKYDSDNAGSDHAAGDLDSYTGGDKDWIEWSVKIVINGEVTSETLGTANHDYIKLRDQFGTSGPVPYDMFDIGGGSSDGLAGQYSSLSIASFSRNLIDSKNLHQEQALAFSGSDPNAQGEFRRTTADDFQQINYFLTTWQLEKLDVDGEPVDVPEPGTLAMLGLGFLGLGTVSRAKSLR